VTEPRTTPPQQAPTRRIASWHPSTIGQWPGHVAAVIELWGCSLTCPGCSGIREQTASADAPSWSDILADIATNRAMLDSIVVTGGEPLEDPDLPSLLATLAELGLTVCLETSGSRPDVLSLLLAEDLVDFVALDVKTVPARYRLISPERDMPARVAECADMLVASSIDHEFRTTVAAGLVDAADLPSIARTLQGGRLYTIQARPAADEAGARPVRDAVMAAAEACQRFLPTVVRGLDAGEG
jgi:pyruvate formate lyase activating enzyme